jgi:Domain of unknown function (DUF1911)
MMSDAEFRAKRRQIYLDKDSTTATLIHINNGISEFESEIARPGYLTRDGAITASKVVAGCKLEVFQLRYTAGEDLTVLAESLTSIIEAYERFAEELLKLPDDDYHPPFIMNGMIDNYIDYLHLLCTAVLLHREDLIPRIHSLNEGTDFDEVDAVIEELLKFYLPDRPELDEWLWKPYRGLLDAIDADTPAERSKDMQKYVKSWYKNLKGIAHFWGKHEQIKPEFTPYFGYWAMCAAAFSYLFDIDDSSYRDEIVYPKDLIDYARSKPRRTVAEAQKLVPQELKRCEGGKPCPETGLWFTPAKSDSQQAFFKGSLMPIYEASDYGETIWYWVPGQVRHQ